jgi:hypothetical protein
MKPKILLRIAALLVLFIVIGQAIGHFNGKATLSPVDKNLIGQMQQHKFNIHSSLRSWGDFYEGFSLDVSLVVIVFTVVFSMLSNIAKKHPKVCLHLLWPYLFCFIGFTLSSLCYLFIIPGIANLIICVLIVWSMLQLHKQAKLFSLLDLGPHHGHHPHGDHIDAQSTPLRDESKKASLPGEI